MSTEVTTTNKLLTFFTTIYGQNKGFVCIASRHLDSTGKTLHEEFFSWPEESAQLLTYIAANTTTANLWYCPHVLSSPRRIKLNVIACPTIWADLDYCVPTSLLVQPSLVIQSSESRYQALWRLSESVEPVEAEHISKRIAYYHAEEAKDKSGWDLTQLLRVPYTYNFKYGGFGAAPQIYVLSAISTTFSIKDFSIYPEVEYNNIADYIGELPESWESASEIFMRYRKRNLSPMIYYLFRETPKEGKWSEDLWNLQLLLFEAGLTPEEVYGVCIEARCNKFNRDGRGPQELWLDIGRAYAKCKTENDQKFGHSPQLDNHKPLLTQEEKALVESNPGIVEDYINWAKTTIDAPTQYHIAGGFTVLSSLLAGNIRLPTEVNIIKPNLWFMVLADTTLTRKTTSMDRAMDFIEEIVPDVVLATEGSVEGIYAQMADRPGVPSVFYRDEFSGLLEGIRKKEYLAGMQELLTKLYDGKLAKKVLSQKTITIKQPCFIIFSGGIKSKIFSLLSYDDVISGFLPRFIFITAESDVTKVRAMGPPTIANVTRKNELLATFTKIYEHYDKAKISVTSGSQTTSMKKIWDAELTTEAWALYNEYESQMLLQATGAQRRELMLPCMSRLATSGLKAAVLLSAARTQTDRVVVTKHDIMHAFYYVEKWRDYLMEVLLNIGKTAYEGMLDQILASLKRAGAEGMLKGEIMRTFKLNSKNMEEILDTLHNRHHILRKSARQTTEVVVLVPDPEESE